MTAVESRAPWAFLYETTTKLWPGYAPEAPFEHMVEVVVSRLTANNEQAYSCVVSESRAPAQFFSAKCSNSEGSHLRMSTGSGTTAGLVLFMLCLALSNGNVSFDPPAGSSDNWTTLRSFIKQPDGCSAELLTSDTDCRVDFGRQSDGLHHKVEPTTLYFRDTDVALNVAQQMSEGMLGIAFGR